MIQTRSMTGYNQQTNILNPSVLREGLKYLTHPITVRQKQLTALSYIYESIKRCDFALSIWYTKVLSKSLDAVRIWFCCCVFYPFCVGAMRARNKQEETDTVQEINRPMWPFSNRAHQRFVRCVKVSSFTLRLTRVHNFFLGLYARESRLQDIEGEVKIVGSSFGWKNL